MVVRSQQGMCLWCAGQWREHLLVVISLFRLISRVQWRQVLGGEQADAVVF